MLSPAGDVVVFAALGDATRLALLEALRGAKALSTSELTEGTSLTRQAVTKHLEVLAEAGLVRDRRRGRTRQWSFHDGPIRQLAPWAASFLQEWEERLDRLDHFLDDEGEDDV